MADEVDAAVNRVQTPGADACRNLLGRDPKLEKLRAGDGAMLKLRERGDPAINSAMELANSPRNRTDQRRGELRPYMGHKRPCVRTDVLVGELCT